jgi:hypothetical protein
MEGGGEEGEEVCVVVLVIVTRIIHSNNTYFKGKTVRKPSLN